MDNNDKERRLKASAKRTSNQIGKQRQAQKMRRCPVAGCTTPPKYYSRYCGYHADRLRRNGHPTLTISTKTKKDYANCLKVGRWLRHAMTKDDADMRAWMRIEDALSRMGRDHSLKHGIPTLARRDGSWRNAFKAKCVLSKRLEQISPEEVLSAFLGLAAVVIEGNDVMVTAKQFEHMIQKSGGKAVTRYMRKQAIDHFSERLYQWKPSTGTITQVGKLVFDAIAKEFGARWWKDAEVALVTKDKAA